MPTSNTIDFDSLTAPISEDSGVGSSLRASPDTSTMYSNLREAQSLARKIERNRIETATLSREELAQYEGRSDDPRKTPDWASVVDQSIGLLTHYSKDLQVTVWLLEGLTRTDSFAGLRDGLILCARLVEQYWDTIFPLPEDGEDLRVTTIEWLNNGLPTAIERTSFVSGDGELHHYAYTIAKQMEKLSPEVLRERVEQGIPDLARFDTEFRDTNVSELKTVTEDLDQAVEAAETLDQLVGSKTPLTFSLSPVVESLKKVRSTFKLLAETYLAKAESATADSSSNQNAGSDAPAASNSSAGSSPMQMERAIQNREDALRGLLKVAEFFRQTEPHSPVSYALEQAVRWGRMPLPELLRELVPNSEVLADLYRRTGIREEESSSY